MKKYVGLLLLLLWSCFCLVGCVVSGNSSGGGSGNTIGLAEASFTPSSITIKKGQSITLVNQSDTVHVVANGFWSGNTQDPMIEKGAPVVNSYTFGTSNASLTIGPFNTAGTFHYYCSVHPGMNLTVVVQ